MYIKHCLGCLHPREKWHAFTHTVLQVPFLICDDYWKSRALFSLHDLVTWLKTRMLDWEKWLKEQVKHVGCYKHQQCWLAKRRRRSLWAVRELLLRKLNLNLRQKKCKCIGLHKKASLKKRKNKNRLEYGREDWWSFTPMESPCWHVKWWVKVFVAKD